jgi:polysaccharide biosynthesis/export protein
MKAKILFLLMSLVCLAQVSFAQEKLVPADNKSGYLVGPGDKVEGKVLGEPDFDFKAIVDEDGKIQVPFSDNGIMAQCRTEKELRSDVSQILAKYLRNPQISVNVVERNSRPPVTIYGEVRSQQIVTLTRKASLLDILASAGGVTEKAGGSIQVFRTRTPMCGELLQADDWRTENKEGINIPSRVYSIGSLRQGSSESNPEVFPGDIIVVQKAAPFYVVGEVQRPGEFSFPEGGLPLTQAMAMASGSTREAKTKDVKIYRRKEGSVQPEILIANYDLIKKGQQKDVILQPYDIIEVGKTKKKIGDVLLDIATGGARSLVNTVPVLL